MHSFRLGQRTSSRLAGAAAEGEERYLNAGTEDGQELALGVHGYLCCGPHERNCVGVRCAAMWNLGEICSVPREKDVGRLSVSAVLADQEVSAVLAASGALPKSPPGAPEVVLRSKHRRGQGWTSKESVPPGTVAPLREACELLGSSAAKASNRPRQ